MVSKAARMSSAYLKQNLGLLRLYSIIKITVKNKMRL